MEEQIPPEAPEQQIQSLAEEVQSWEDTLGKCYCVLVLLSPGIPAALGESSRLEGPLTWPWLCSVAGDSPWYIPRKPLSSPSSLPCESLAAGGAQKAKPMKAIPSVLCQPSSQRRKLISPLGFVTVNKPSLVGFLLILQCALCCQMNFPFLYLQQQILWDIYPMSEAQHSKPAKILP